MVGGIEFWLPTEEAVCYSPGTMQRWTAVVVGAFLMVMIGALVWKGGRRSFLTEVSKVDAGPGENHEQHAVAEGGVLDDPLLAGSWDLDAGAQAMVGPSSDADPSGHLPSGSPKMVRFGVILVQYRGAQLAPLASRSKDDAFTLARSLAEAARTDFKAQVSKGDPGSMDDAGRIPRGVLEPSTEFALFTLGRGDVSDPVDTPRGYWIVKRIE
jgi:hypothetical protein